MPAPRSQGQSFLRILPTPPLPLIVWPLAVLAAGIPVRANASNSSKNLVAKPFQQMLPHVFAERLKHEALFNSQIVAISVAIRLGPIEQRVPLLGRTP